MGLEVGYTLYGSTLGAPDISVGNVTDAPGWVKGAPLLAIDDADTGQDERYLKPKISELLRAGTKHVWVVRLTGPRRVEVHTHGRSVETVLPGHYLHAPGILKNAVLVEALTTRTQLTRPR